MRPYSIHVPLPRPKPCEYETFLFKNIVYTFTVLMVLLTEVLVPTTVARSLLGARATVDRRTESRSEQRVALVRDQNAFRKTSGAVQRST